MAVRKDDSVDLAGLSAEAWLALHVADQLHVDLVDRELVVTSAAEPIEHSVPRSAHHRGDAIDLRRWYTDAAEVTGRFVELLQRELGDAYVVIEEETHIHVHWSPKL